MRAHLELKMLRQTPHGNSPTMKMHSIYMQFNSIFFIGTKQRKMSQLTQPQLGTGKNMKEQERTGLE